MARRGVPSYSAWSSDEAGWNTWGEHASWLEPVQGLTGLMCRLNKTLWTVVGLGCACLHNAVIFGVTTWFVVCLS